jgi:SH3 domain-containing YSC84-like protein 1
MHYRKQILMAGAALLLSGTVGAAPAIAMDYGNTGSNSTYNKNAPTVTNRRATTGSAEVNETTGKKDARQLINEAVKEVQKMEKDPQLKKLMAKAKGIYLVPEFGRGALVVGGRGGAGVVLAHVNGEWTDPAFYDFGTISIGPQVGASGGQVAFLLMSQGAVDQFKSGNKVSLNAGAGFTIVTYSANAQASWGKGDIIFWSDTAGAYAGVTVSATDINWVDKDNKAFYGKKVDPSAVLSGKVKTPDAAQLKQVLPS